YREAVRLDPASAQAHIKLAEAVRTQGRNDEAIAELKEELRLNPSSAPAHTDLGYLLLNQDTDAAVSELRAAIKADPDYSEAHNYMAVTYARTGKFPEAVAEFQEMVRIDSDSVLGYYNLGLAL